MGLIYIRNLILCFAVEDVVENVDRGTGLEGNAGSQALVVNVLDEFLGAGLLVGGSGGFVGGGGVDGGFVVEAVEIASGLLEFLDPFLWLLTMVNMLFLEECLRVARRRTDLGDHHVAIEGALAKGLGRLVNMRTDHCDNGSAKGHVGDEMAVHDIDMEPICAMADGV